jgi:transcription antitermination factor NusG
MLSLKSVAGENKGSEPWHALHTRHQHEKSVDELLVRQGLETFLPLYKTVHLWKDRSKQLSLPLFVNYVFFRGGAGRRLQILKTPGVCSIVEIAGRPGVIPDEEIAAIRRVVENSSRIEPHPFLRKGDWVRIRSGPLAGLEGILVRNLDRLRLVISVEMLGRSVAVEVEPDLAESGKRSDADQARVLRRGSSANTRWFEFVPSPTNRTETLANANLVSEPYANFSPYGRKKYE